MTLANICARGEAPIRGCAREVSPETQIDDREDHVPPELATAHLFQDTLLMVLSVLEIFTHGGCETATPQDFQTIEWAKTQKQQQAPVIKDGVGQPPVDPMVWNDLTPAVGGQNAQLIVLTEVEQHRYEKFQKMDPPQF
ncbi:hypothetical protein KY290_012751 [Solanum tuberosum]|uniref:Uncharacterized protein n=1 Tax=Solanum tuberosum TaxID=4113 RepID=A0ABQ7VKH5_SOLTU|nr:hypothetical protein KY290_012751 [Solanum tuberosum]